MGRLIALVLLSSCRYADTFQCFANEQCRADDAAGTCQPEGVCAFAASDCPSGLRFADNAGALAGTCVSGSDAGIDAPPFDLSLCPASYQELVDATSRHRIIDTRADVKAQAAACAADLPGATHLVTLSSLDELTALRGRIGLWASTLWVGVVQRSDATTPTTGWLHFSGEPVFGLWQAPEPDNNGVAESSPDRAQFAAISRSAGLRDEVATQTYGAICECDGVPVPPSVQQLLD